MEKTTVLKKCECGCGKTTNPTAKKYGKRGYVKGQEQRFHRGHSPVGAKHVRRTTKQLNNLYTLDFDTGCWNWNLKTNDKGYGLWRGLGVGEKHQMAHRAMYAIKYGAIPTGMHLDHLCGNTGCVNPDHLEPVSAAENTRRKYDRCHLSLNFIVINAMNAFKDSIRFLKSTTNSKENAPSVARKHKESYSLSH